MKRGLTVVLAALVLLTGCELRYRAISKLDITDAESLYLVPEAEARGAGNVMFKITKGGAVVEVSYTSNSGIKASTKSLNPTAIYHANDEYMVMVFDNSFACLVAKKTGAVYSLENVGVPLRETFNALANSTPVQTDKKNNIYYISETAGSNKNVISTLHPKYYDIYRINVSNPEKVFAEPISALTEDPESFLVDGDGNVFYSFSYVGQSGAGNLRLAFADGSLHNEPVLVSWVGPDGKFYNKEYSSSDGFSKIYRLDIVGKDVKQEFYGQVQVKGGENYFATEDRAYLVNITDGIVTEVYNPEGNLERYEFDYKLTGEILASAVEGMLFYFATAQEAVCLDLKTKTWRYLYQSSLSDEYEIYQVTYSGGGFTVNALRYSDAKIIMGKIDEAGKMKVLDEKSNSKVLYLTRIR